MGQKKSKMTKYESDEMKKLQEILEKDGPAAANAYLELNIRRWKTETVKLAVSGCTATGKSTFINTLRGVKRGDESYAEVGFGDTTMGPTPYSHPKNEKIIYYDLAGVGTLKMKKENYINNMKISDYDFIFIFIDKVINEDTFWLVNEIYNLGKPFCFVRSKIDEDIKSAERENIDTKLVIPTIRRKIEEALEGDDKLKNAKKVFLISCVDPSIGELSELITFVESNMDKFKSESMMESVVVFSHKIINLKYKTLKTRIKKISVASASIAAIPVPGLDVALNIALLVEEVMHYINVFGLSSKKMQALDSFDRRDLKCSRILIPSADMAAYVISRLGVYATIMVAESFLDLMVPFIGSLISGATSAFITYRFLNGILDDIRDDAIAVYDHIDKHQSNMRL